MVEQHESRSTTVHLLPCPVSLRSRFYARCFCKQTALVGASSACYSTRWFSPGRPHCLRRQLSLWREVGRSDCDWTGAHIAAVPHAGDWEYLAWTTFYFIPISIRRRIVYRKAATSTPTALCICLHSRHAHSAIVFTLAEELRILQFSRFMGVPEFIPLSIRH